MRSFVPCRKTGTNRKNPCRLPTPDSRLPPQPSSSSSRISPSPSTGASGRRRARSRRRAIESPSSARRAAASKRAARRWKELRSTGIASGKPPDRLGTCIEYAWALAAEFVLALRVYAQTRFRILHACNPPDTIFLVALFFKLFGVRFIFDHHDLNPELLEAKFGSQRGLFHWLLCLAERLTFRTADVSIATNESYREVALTRGGMKPERAFIVRSCPDLSEDPPQAAATGTETRPAVSGRLSRHDGTAGRRGPDAAVGRTHRQEARSGRMSALCSSAAGPKSRA